MSGYWWAPDDYQQDAGITQGSAHSVSSETPEQDRAEQVRQVAEEITRQSFQKPARRIGFTG